MIIVEGLELNSRSWEEGTILDPKSGKTYSCYITFENINTLDISDVTLNIFKNHNSKSETVILSKYKLGNIIEIDSISELPLLKYEQSRNQFFFEFSILLSFTNSKS